jgi:hypothetical protein
LLPDQVREELVETVSLPRLRLRERLKGIGEILMVRAVHRCGSTAASCRMSAASSAAACAVR